MDVRFCVECGRQLRGSGARRAVCDAHVDAGRLLGRRSESTLRILAAKHAAGDASQLDVVHAPPHGRDVEGRL